MNDSAWLQGLSLDARRHVPLQQLVGARSGKRSASHSRGATEAYVGNVARPSIRADLDRVYDELRTHYRFRRNELECLEDAGVGAIHTPRFVYECLVSPHPEDGAQTTWHRRLSHFHTPDDLLSPELDAVFARTFDTIEFAPPGTIDLERFVDTLEAREDEALTLLYDRQLTVCEVVFAPLDATLQVRANGLCVVHPVAQPPAALLETVQTLRAHVVELTHLPLTPH